MVLSKKVSLALCRAYYGSKNDIFFESGFFRMPIANYESAADRVAFTVCSKIIFIAQINSDLKMYITIIISNLYIIIMIMSNDAG